MKRSTHIFIQLVALIAQFANLDLSSYPHTAQLTIGLVLALAQAVVAWYNHNFNPDGTPATVAYEPKK